MAKYIKFFIPTPPVLAESNEGCIMEMHGAALLVQKELELSGGICF